jgi:cellulose synthase/poly-beta-1,6-N-acetylglucosamine synthase-like glycosyltransferase
MISVIVPAYNAAARLPDCLVALQRQTCPPEEIIVVDDGSKDETVAVARSYGVQVIEQNHLGAPSARNLGLQQMRGDVVLFTDADCEPIPNWISEMVRPLSDPDVAGVKGSYRTYQRQVVARLAQCEFEERYDLLERFPSIDFVDSYSAAFRVAALREVGGFAPDLLGDEDGDLSYRLVRRGFRLVFNRRAIVYHRHPVTWGDYWRRKFWRGYWRTVVFRLHPRKVVRDSHTPQLLKLQIVLIYLAVAVAILALILPSLVWLVAVWCVALLASAMPFTLKVKEKEPQLVQWSPLFIVVRAVAFALGVAGAFIGVFVLRDPAEFIRRLSDVLWPSKKPTRE